MGASSAERNYVEDVFSVQLYTGNGSGNQTITNGINLAGYGGAVWSKSRSAAEDHRVNSSAYSSVSLRTNLANATIGYSCSPVFTSTGYTLSGSSGGTIGINTSGVTYVSWSFRKATNFFDVLTYIGDGANRTIAHNLGSVPGMIIIKRRDASGDWQVYHRSLANTEYTVLNSTVAKATGATRWNSTTPTSSVFSLGTDATVNASGGYYVAYLFAHDAGGFGDSSADSVTNCGSYTGNGSTTGPTVTLGWEPQWLLIKRTDSTGDWQLIDSTRGFVVSGTDAELNPNLNNAESTGTFVSPLSTGFQLNTTDVGYNASGGSYIYVAIRKPAA